MNGVTTVQIEMPHFAPWGVTRASQFLLYPSYSQLVHRTSPLLRLFSSFFKYFHYFLILPYISHSSQKIFLHLPYAPPEFYKINVDKFYLYQFDFKKIYIKFVRNIELFIQEDVMKNAYYVIMSCSFSVLRIE